MFDVLIVGAGSAGCAIAARVSEDPALSVGLIEAGPDYPDLTRLPKDLRNGNNNSYTAHDWGMEYAPTPLRKDRFPRGRVVGGSSAVNTTIALRGLPEDYDAWAAAGNDGWSWQDVLPAFKRLERDLDYPEASYHGDSGPISIRRHPYDELLPAHQAFLQSATDLGYPDCPDANDPWAWGAGPQPMNKLNGVRISGAVGYLASARIRENLTIIPNTLVLRLVVAGGKCTGVEVEDETGAVSEISARLVVLSAGALMTPSMLMRSGIGAREEVADIGVDLARDLPGVGKNLSDHPALSVLCELKEASLIDFDAPIIQTILRYTGERSEHRCDLQIEQISFAGRRGGPPMFLLAPVLEYQYGRGQLRFTSADAHVAPVIENQFCADERDRAILAGCVLDTLAFTRSAPLADMIAAVKFPDPGRGHSREAIESLCQKFAGSGYHPCGTAKMGPDKDPMAVVDARCRLYGVDQLVVADASIMPAVPRANTNLTCFMIGEKVGEWIRTERNQYGL